MKIEKALIKRSFAMAADTYDSSSGLQMEVAGELSALVIRHSAAEGVARAANAAQARGMAPFICPRRILDIGSGTGHLTALLRATYRDSSLYAADIAVPMLKKAVGKRISAGFVASDSEAMPFKDSSFDVAASSLAYQWASSFECAAKEAARILATGGLFAFSTLGPKTLWELRECFSSDVAASMPGFIGIRDVEDALGRAGFDVEWSASRLAVKRYGSMKELLLTLKRIGASPPIARGKAGLSMGMELRRAEKEYGARFSLTGGGIPATYEILYVAARKAR